MPVERFDRVIDQMKGWGGPLLKVLKLSLYGEPLLNPRFGEMLRTAKEAGIAERIETTTNASLLTPDVARALVEGGLDYARVSIYSPLQQRHEKVTGSRIEIGAIHRNLAALREVKARLGSATPFVSVKMLDTYGEENDLFRRMYEDVADEIYLDKPHNWVAVEGKDFIDDLYGAQTREARKDLEATSSRRIACTLPFFTLAVRSTGDVSPCCIDWVGETKIGNVEEQTLAEIRRGDRMFEFRKMHLQDRKDENASCRNCELFRSDYYTRDNVDGFPVERLRPSRP